MQTIGFLGGGRVARILTGGWAHGRALPSSILVHEPDEAAFAALTPYAGTAVRATAQEAAAADVVFVALHPPAIADALGAVRAALRPDGVLVSLAPKVTLAAIAAATGHARVARLIPNAPSLIGRGYNPVSFGPGVDEPTRAELRALFAPWGAAPEVGESTLEAYAIVAAMGPTYFWFQWQAMRELAAGLTLTEGECDTALRAMVHGSLATLLESGLSPSAVMDLVPVKPLAGMEPAVLEAYRTALPALFAKISPPAPAVVSGR